MNLTHHRRCFHVQRRFFIKRRKNVNEKKLISESIKQMGIGRLFDGKLGIRVRIVWFFIILLCSAGCFNHIAIRIREFIENPVVIDLHLQHKSHVFFPSITICSGILGSYLKQDLNLWYTQKMCMANKSHCTERQLSDVEYLSKPINHSQVEYMWYEEAAIQSHNIEVSESCSSLISFESKKCEQTNFPIPLHFVNTIWGRCVDLSFPNAMPYRGSFTGFTIKFDTSEIEKYEALEEEYYFYLHSSGVSPRHDAPYIAQAVKVGYETAVQVFIQEYKFLNTRHKPCTSEEESVQCHNICLDKLMENNISCSLPFVESRKLRNCETVADFFTSFQAAYKVYSTVKSTDCQCKQKCKKVAYTLTRSKQKLESKNFTHIVLTYPQNMYETIVENPVYSQSALISEIGGTLGLYLGLSLMRIFDVVELLFYYLSYIK